MEEKSIDLAKERRRRRQALNEERVGKGRDESERRATNDEEVAAVTVIVAKGAKRLVRMRIRNANRNCAAKERGSWKCSPRRHKEGLALPLSLSEQTPPCTFNKFLLR